MTKPEILATDLDGTLIPLPGNRGHQADLKQLDHQIHAQGNQFIYVTGRHKESVLKAIEEFQLPRPDWLICDVGSTICRLPPEAGEFEVVAEYYQRLDQLAAGVQAAELASLIGDRAGLELQEPEKQGPYKCSFYCDKQHGLTLVEELETFLKEHRLQYGIIHSVDPFNGDGLIDLLPDGVSKSHALQWWLDWKHISRDAIVFAGDSGNDLAAMIEGYKTIIVANAPEQLKQRVKDFHREQNWRDRVFVADATATSGVLQGWNHFSNNSNS